MTGHLAYGSHVWYTRTHARTHTIMSWSGPQSIPRAGFAWDGQSAVKRPRVAGASAVVQQAFTQARVVGRDTAEFDTVNPRVNVTRRLRLFEDDAWSQAIDRSAPVFVLKTPPTEPVSNTLHDVDDDDAASSLYEPIVAVTLPVLQYMLHVHELQGNIDHELTKENDGKPTVEWVKRTWAYAGVNHTDLSELMGEGGDIVRTIEIKGRYEVQNLWGRGAGRGAPRGGAHLHFVVRRMPVQATTMYIPIAGQPPRHLSNIDRHGNKVHSVIRIVPVWTHDGVVKASQLEYEQNVGFGATCVSYGFAWYVGRVVRNTEVMMDVGGGDQYAQDTTKESMFNAEQSKRGQTLTVDLQTFGEFA